MWSPDPNRRRSPKEMSEENSKSPTLVVEKKRVPPAYFGATTERFFRNKTPIQPAISKQNALLVGQALDPDLQLVPRGNVDKP